jgi:hypothetical protein
MVLEPNLALEANVVEVLVDDDLGGGGRFVRRFSS